MTASARLSDGASSWAVTACDDSVLALGLSGLSEAIRSKRLSCTELMDRSLRRIDRLNPLLNAVVAMPPREQLMAAARERDREIAQGQWRGPLHGIPQAPKDVLAVKGMRTTRGSPIFRCNVPTESAVSNQRLLDSGAIFVGRSNTPEFGLGGHTYNTVYGTTRNAGATHLSAGGSSGGAAVAVATCMLACADGTDMMGSLRTPAAFNQVFGLRTTPGMVPHGPGNEVFWQQFSVTGPMARDTRDLELMLSVQSGPDVRLPLSTGRGAAHVVGSDHSWHIGWLGDLGGHLPMDAGLLAACERGLDVLRANGHTVEHASLDFDFSALWQAWIDLRSFTVAGGNAALYRNPETRPLLKPEAVWEIERGLSLSGAAVFDASVVRTSFYQRIARLLERYDCLVLPSVQVFPFATETTWPRQIGSRAMDTYHRWMEVSLPATMAGLPALSVPAGFAENGLPVGLQLIGRPWSDLSLVATGRCFDPVG